ncbi:response regulator [Candidatus Sumerlaeota bacterium]|nr:response regulator [Candidatus Sumerlaeota bacterium]
MTPDTEYNYPRPLAETLWELNRRHERLVQGLSIMRQIDEFDDPALDLEIVFLRLLGTLSLGLRAENASLMLLDPTGEFLELRAACSPLEEEGQSFGSGEWSGKRFQRGEGIAGKVAQTGKPFRLDDTTKSSEFAVLKSSDVEVRSLLCYPLILKDRPIGVLNMSQSRPAHFSIESERILALVAQRAARVVATHLLHDQVRRSEEHYRLVSTNASDGLLVLDPDGRVLDANPAVERITGVRVREILSGDVAWTTLVHEEDRLLLRQCRSVASQSGGPAMVEYRLIDSSGKTHHVEERCTLLRGARGEEPLLVSVLRDTTERRRAEEERRSLEMHRLESLNRMAGGIAHDFNNLLMGITGNTNLMLMDLSPDSPFRESVEEIEDSALRAQEMVSQLLAFSGLGTFLVQTLDLTRLVREMHPILEASIPSETALEMDLDEAVPSIKADATQLRRLVTCLLNNSVESLVNRDGTIAIRTGAIPADRSYLASCCVDDDLVPGRYVYLEVEDTGCGIDGSLVAKIFDPFFTTKFTGRGLGLAAVLGIARAHKGTVRLESEPGRGTRVRVLFPVVKGAPKPAPRHDESSGEWQAGGTVLLVDDEATILGLGKRMLEKAGFTVLAAADGKEAVDVFSQRHADIVCVLLNLSMPRMGGGEALAAIRKIRSDVPIIVASGYSEEEVAKQFASGTLAGIIQKPYRFSDLIALLRQVLSSPH